MLVHRRLASALAVLAVLVPRTAAAWIWPEHRDIAVVGVQGLSPADRATLEAMWASLKTVAGPQLCPTLVNPGATPQGDFASWQEACLDFPSYPALGGDHSCSTAELKAVTETEAWGKKVAWVAEWSKKALAAAPDEGVRTDAWNRSHLAMQYVDPAYLTRAAGNNGHFPPPRARVADQETLDAFVERAVAPGTPMNATALYAQYHALALRLAALWAAAPEDKKPGLARRTLLAEGVALHFLEDSFSSGHYAATWGTAAWQKGTHDLYCVQGLTSQTWAGELYAGYGDAHMRDRDRDVAGAAVKKSLAQVTAAATGRLAVSAGPITGEEKAVEDVDFCKAASLPAMPVEPVARAAAVSTLRDTPISSGSAEEVHPPRARADIGPFVGVVAGVTGGPAFGGFDTSAGWRWRTELEVGARVGYGLDGVLTTNMDGQIWAQVSFVNDAAQLDASCPGCAGGQRTNSAIPRVPARSGLKLVFRMPYYVLPFDLILLAPPLLLMSPEAAEHVVFSATSGGLWTLQRPISTSWGTFQFMAGREFGITFWGSSKNPDQFIATPDGADAFLVDFEQLELDFPVFEWTPPRAFATNLSLAAELQLGFSVQLAPKTWLPAPATGPFTMGPSWFVYLRLRLDGRKYFGGSPEDWKN